MDIYLSVFDLFHKVMYCLVFFLFKLKQIINRISEQKKRIGSRLWIFCLLITVKSGCKVESIKERICLYVCQSFHVAKHWIVWQRQFHLHGDKLIMRKSSITLYIAFHVQTMSNYIIWIWKLVPKKRVHLAS